MIKMIVFHKSDHVTVFNFWENLKTKLATIMTSGAIAKHLGEFVH